MRSNLRRENRCRQLVGNTASASVSQSRSGRQIGAATNACGKPSKPAASELLPKAPRVRGMLQVGDRGNHVAEVRALPFEQRRDVHEHAVRLGLEVTDVRRPAVLVDARGP